MSHIALTGECIQGSGVNFGECECVSVNMRNTASYLICAQGSRGLDSVEGLALEGFKP